MCANWLEQHSADTGLSELQMMREANDKVGPQYQRMTWDALRKSLNGLINKVNIKNIKDILPEIFSEVHLVHGAASKTVYVYRAICSALLHGQALLLLL